MQYIFITVTALAAAGCGKQITLPSVQASSAHFHYFATSVDRIPAGILDRLEQHRNDISSALGISDAGAIDYYRFDQVQDFSSYLDGCQEATSCTIGKSVFTTSVFDQHELIHSYLSDWHPVQMLAEGSAEAFHCGDALRDWVFAVPSTMDWTTVVAKSPSDTDIYRWGVRLVLYLIRAYGSGRFLEYYQTTHQTDDPALFALEFERFWGQSIDRVWTILAANLGSAPLPICPCGQPIIPVDGSPMDVSEFDDYRVLPPALDSQTFTMSLDGSGPRLARCAGGQAIPLRGINLAGRPLVQPALAAILPDDDRYYVSFAGAGSITGQWTTLLQPSCLTAGLLTIPQGIDYLALVAPRPSDGTPWYMGIAQGYGFYRVDADPASVAIAQDCSPASVITPLTSGEVIILGISPQVLGLTLPSAASTGAGMEGVVFQIQR